MKKKFLLLLNYLNIPFWVYNPKHGQISSLSSQSTVYVLAKYPKWYSILICYLHIHVIDSQLAIEVLCDIAAKPHGLQTEGRVISGPYPSEFYITRVAPCHP